MSLESFDWFARSQNYGSKTPFLTKMKTLHNRCDLPFQGKFWPAITCQEIELESYSNLLKTR